MRTVINHSSVAELLVVAAALAVIVVAVGVWLVRRFVPPTREGFDAEVSS